MTKPIVVGMDLSEPSLLALEEAIPIARRRGAAIVMAHATPIPTSSFEYEWVNPAMVERYREALKAELATTRTRLGEIRERHQGMGVELSLSLISNTAENGIIEIADSVDAQLIVVGSHGRVGLDRFLLGSVAERISRFTTRDVLVARSTKPGGDYKNVLVATDFSETADTGFERALGLAGEKARITLLHCVQVPPAVAGFVSGEVLLETETAVGARAAPLAERGREAGFEMTIAIEAGYPPTHIRQRADEHDLIVMGSHGRRGFRRFVLGSVAEKTIRHAPCSVYIARSIPTDEGW